MPSEVVPNYEQNEDFLKKVHHVILEVYTVCKHMPSYYSKPKLICSGFQISILTAE